MRPAGVGDNLMAFSGKHRPRRPEEIKGKAVRSSNTYFGENNFTTKDSSPQGRDSVRAAAGPPGAAMPQEKARRTWESPK